MKEHIMKLHEKEAEHHRKMHAHHTRMAAEHQSMMEHHNDMKDSASEAQDSGTDDNNPSGIEEAETPVGSSFGNSPRQSGFSHIANR